jgi:formylglycine-generating enzyme required for sulfatase activity
MIPSESDVASPHEDLREARFESAERVIGDWLERREAGSPWSSADILAAHPELETELRELLPELSAMDEALERLQERWESRVKGIDRLLGEIGSTADFASRYSIDGPLARGGMGAILRVLDHKLGRPLAMKVMLRQAGDHACDTPPITARQLARFRDEARIMGCLQHPGIVPVHELGVDPEGRAYFTMKLVNGQTLASVFERQSSGDPNWTRPRVLTLIQRVCEAVAYAHGQGVIHRDLKPTNVMVGGFGEVYVMDWGLARQVGGPDLPQTADAPDPAGAELREQVTLTREGGVIGTPDYMSPEQAAGRIADMSPASDVYSLGAMLYRMIAGHPPYRRREESVASDEVLQRVAEGPPPPLLNVAPDAPPELVAICERAMARRTEARYQDVGDLAADLTAYVEGRVVTAYETGAWAEARKWVHRNSPLAASLAAAILLLVAGLVMTAVLRGHAVRNLELAEERRQEAQSNELLAQQKEAEAQRQAILAEDRADEVLRLSALQDLEDLIAEADALWPVEPEKIGAYEDWIRTARELVSDVAVHRATRERLREHALPRTDEERTADAHTHPDRGALESARREVAYRRALVRCLREGAQHALPPIDLPSYPAIPWGLNLEAWWRVDPRREVFGEEATGLVLAREALKGASPKELSAIGDTLAWAHFALGRDEEALATYRQVARDALPHERDGYQASLEAFETAIAFRSSVAGLEQEQGLLDETEVRLSSLETRVAERRTWRFPESRLDQRWWDSLLTKLIDGLAALEDGLLSDHAVVDGHGWSVPRRLAYARAIEPASTETEGTRQLWTDAIAAISASPRYGELTISPQRSLLPLGTDPESGLWEFAELQTGEPARRGADGRLELHPETGVVLVLLPGSTFQMGAQSQDPEDANYDPEATPIEEPVRTITISPYFLSKFEMTSAQWRRIAGSHPCDCITDGSGPVHFVSWLECNALCTRLGLTLPSEAQWEYATRAGTTSPWCCGTERETLQLFANLADVSGRDNEPREDLNYEPWNDGWRGLARIGHLGANAFGLHDVHGNVGEWCLDSAVYYGRPDADNLDPVVQSDYWQSRIYRGGSYNRTGTLARSSHRHYVLPDLRAARIGLRPARHIDYDH